MLISDVAEGLSQRRRRFGAVEVIGVGLIATLLLVCLMVWLDNVHISTTNGLWKSVPVDQWKADPEGARLDHSNYLYFPLVATLCRLLDAVGIQTGETWRQMASINTVFAGVSVAIVYWMIRRLVGRRDIAAIAALFHLGCAFFLSLAIMNEDIMPGYTLVLAAMAMAAVWFSAATALQVACVAAVFTLGWMMEWRLMFPALPPLLLALALSSGPVLRRAGLILLFVVTMLAVALLAVLFWSGHAGAAGLMDVLWTGKGVHTAWAGFSLYKLSRIVSGMGEFWLGGRILGGGLSARAAEWGLSFAVQMVVLAAFAAIAWRNRHDRVVRNVAIIFLGTLLAGQVMNAYSQPEDPQMQINVMAWLTVAVAFVLTWVARRSPSVVLLAALLVLAPLAYNVRSFVQLQGQDGWMQAALKDLESLSDPARTVYVYSSFEGIITWQYATWGHRWAGVCDLGQSPQAVPKFKWIAFWPPIVEQPSLTPAEYADRIVSELNCAFDKGYTIIAAPAWADFEGQLDGWMTLLHAREHGLALQSALEATARDR